MTEVEKFLQSKGISRNDFEQALSLLVECINDGSQELKIEVEPELMTLQEAFKKGNEDDTLKSKNKFFILGVGSDYEFSFHEATQPIWQIIPAEPKVLTPEEYFNKKYFKKGGGVGSVNIKDVFRDGEENQWLNHKEPMKAFVELLEKAKRYMGNHTCNDFTAYIEHAEKALKNLKPLKAECSS